MSQPKSNEGQRQEFGLLFGATLNYDQQLMEAIWDWYLAQKDAEVAEAKKEATLLALETMWSKMHALGAQAANYPEKNYHEAMKALHEACKETLNSSPTPHQNPTEVE